METGTFFTGRLPVKQLVASLEDASNTTVREEHEYVFFGRMGSLEELEALSVKIEKQEQYSLLKPNGTIRTRAIDNEMFELTTKIWTPGVAGKEEETVPCSVVLFNHFKAIADSGMKKTRYVVPIAGTEGTWTEENLGKTPLYNGALYWEFDVAFGQDENRFEWVKVDLEFPKGYRFAALPPFPVPLQDTITNQFGHRTPEEEAFIRNLYDTQYCFKLNAA